MPKEKVTSGNHELKPQPMVKWYDLFLLRHTAFQVSVSSIFGKFADTRETFSRSLEPKTIDYSEGGQVNELWIDYIADTGDGFNSTYSIAYLLQQEYLQIEGLPGKLPRGKILVMGGDEIYPYATHEDYTQRLWLPFKCAFPFEDLKHKLNDADKKKLPHVYAIPGNHDWYDGLSNFLKFFCQKRSLGGWQTKQVRSYFAMKLPHDIWLWGIDIQLEGDIDKIQLDYFQKIALTEMKNNDRLILCTAEPVWVHINTEEGRKRFAKLNFFISNYVENICNESKETRNLDLCLLISGDLHHYAHYIPAIEGDFENFADHCITAGGGGAFMHPTHNLHNELNLKDEPGSSSHNNLFLKNCFPAQDSSKRMAAKNLLFPFHNYTLSLLLPIIMLVIMLLTESWSIVRGTSNHVANSVFTMINYADMGTALLRLLGTSLITPPALLIMAIFLYGICTFRDNVHGNKYKNLLFGIFHAIMHVIVGMILMTWLLKKLWFIHEGNDIAFYFVLAFAYLAAGWLIHGEIFGIYLFIANRVFKCHDTEAFSHLAIPDYKNIIKLHITKEGTLEVYPIGINKVSKDWNWDSNPGDEFGKPKITPKKNIDCHLIHEIIKINKNTSRD